MSGRNCETGCTCKRHTNSGGRSIARCTQCTETVRCTAHPRTKKGRICPDGCMCGRHFSRTEEIKRRIGESSKRNWQTPEYRKKWSASIELRRQTPEYQATLGKCQLCTDIQRCLRHLGYNRGKHWTLTDETRKRQQLAQQNAEWKKRPQSLETRQKRSRALTGIIRSEETRKRMSSGQRKAYEDPERRLKMKHAALNNWQIPGYAKKVLKANAVRPNRLEETFQKLTGLTYVGNGELIINGKNPDFWDGEHKLVEVYGDWWHRGQDPQERIDMFKQHGYDCLVVWEHEINQNPLLVKQRVQEFVA